MKKYCLQILFIAGCFILSLQSQAQVDSAKAAKIKGQLIDSVCACISKSDVSKIKTIEDMQNAMVQCQGATNIQILYLQYTVAAGINPTDMQKQMEALQSFSMDLAMQCPAMMTIMMNIAQDPEQLKKATDMYNKMQAMPSDDKKVVPQKN